ncbi:methyltransferase domain-containing protein [Calothrix sp. PCC 6303]|uniref:methyltransferase domain-containing protein n=1 Tax=Calothrix sp. PCC 6303 TaxID=1170562 RepID=UPI001EEF891B|nr:class I SAM-dependent methyltransferase [Calothrix sp. PCC 6303]
MILLQTFTDREIPIVNQERYILEQKIIPYFIENSSLYRILFVGCGSYTKHYRKWFLEKDYWTIDYNPMKAIYGSKKHVTDSLTNLNLHFKPSQLDGIICNGVFGWGLNDREDVEKAFSACFESLRVGGILVIGWDDVPDKKPFPLNSCKSINQFKPYLFQPLNTSEYFNEEDSSDTHRYSFYIKC